MAVFVTDGEWHVQLLRMMLMSWCLAIHSVSKFCMREDWVWWKGKVRIIEYMIYLHSSLSGSYDFFFLNPFWIIVGNQAKQIYSTDRVLFVRGQHASMINGLQGRYPVYCPVVRWDFWVYSNLICPISTFLSLMFSDSMWKKFWTLEQK